MMIKSPAACTNLPNIEMQVPLSRDILHGYPAEVIAYVGDDLLLDPSTDTSALALERAADPGNSGPQLSFGIREAEPQCFPNEYHNSRIELSCLLGAP